MVMSYHSLEDRLVKQSFRRWSQEGVLTGADAQSDLPFAGRNSRQPARAQRQDARRGKNRRASAGRGGGMTSLPHRFEAD